MRQKAIGFAVFSVGLALSMGACATGRIADEGDSGPRRDSGTDSSKPVNDGSTTQDTGTTQKDSSTPIQDGSSCMYTVCGNLCVDTSIDDNNCGQCNKVCSGGSSCTNSTCQCSGGMTLCSNVCVDTMTDNSNCGTCGHACATNTTCMSGTCQSTSTAPPQGSCSHSLCDLNDDTALIQGCDTTGCVISVCNSDSYCCDYYWDSYCVSEVAMYCSPYTC